MKIHSRTLMLLLLGGASIAHAAPPVAQFSCASGGNFIPGESQVNFNAPALKFNLSHFDIGVVNSSSDSGTGAPAGKVTLQPFSFHAALARFSDLYSAVVAGGTFSECSLDTTSPSGDVVQYVLKSVMFKSVDAIANSNTQSAFSAVTASYAGIAIRILQTGTDNGGTGTLPN